MGSVLASVLFVFWKLLDEVVEAEPKGPTVMVKGDRKDHGDDEQQYQYVLIIGANHQQTEEAEDQDHELGGDDVCQDRAHEEPVLAFVERQANGAMMADMERALDD